MSIRHKKNIAAHFRGIYQGNKDKGVKQDYIEEGKTSTPTVVTFFCCHHPWPWNCPLPLKGLLRKGNVYLTSSIPTTSSIPQTENILSFKGQGFCDCDDFEKFQCLLVEFAVTSQLIYSVSAVATSNECFKYLPEKQTLNIDRLPLI